MSKYIDYKATVWFRVPIESEEALDKIKEMLNEGCHPDHLYDEVYEHLGQCEPLDDTEEYMLPMENGGCSTIELYDEEHNILWDNSHASMHEINVTLEE